MAKTRKKRRTGRKARPRRAGSGAVNPRLLVGAGVLLILVVLGAFAFDDRHWHAFNDAGDGAYERHNFEYAENMYRKALTEARRLEDRHLIDGSLADLQRATHAQGRSAEAARFAAERTALGR
ncbi:MAG: hypothetical protein HN712_13920 [Gemmatimonadetes bacterium]|jgi:hypothetical protein|nr:hypothetical protein [Gemmatimonadota bacterium]MBT7861415.1 hypothetical protein [Gemmatimonadota bacterium]